MTTPEVAKAPALFLRNATGLVKGWSAFDAFGYSFFSVNLVTLGMFYSLAIFAFVPDGSVLSALILSGVTMTFLCIVYAGLIAVMPRAGGDYVWQTRIFDGVPGAVVAAVVGALTGYLAANAFALGDAIAIVAGVVGLAIGAVLGMKRGGIGFVLSSTGWWFILALWAPSTATSSTSSSCSRSRRSMAPATCSLSSDRRPGRSPSRSSRSSSPPVRSPWAWLAMPGSSV